MPRIKGPPKVQWAIKIPEDLAAQIELLITDPVRGKPTKGMKSNLVVSLLFDWLAARRRGASPLRDSYRPVIREASMGYEVWLERDDKKQFLCATQTREWAEYIKRAISHHSPLREG